MFGKLKDKLKSTFSIFSKKVEAEAEVNEVNEDAAKPIDAVESNISDLGIDRADDVADGFANEGAYDNGDQAKIESIEKQGAVNDNKIAKDKTIKTDFEHEGKKVVEKGSLQLPSAEELLNSELDEVGQKLIFESEFKNSDERKDFIESQQDDQLENQKLVDKKRVEEIKVFKEESVGEPVTETVKQPVKESMKEPVKGSVKEIVNEPEVLKKSLFSKIKQKLTTRTINQEKFNQLFWNLEVVLLESNVSVKVIERIKEDLSFALVNKPLPRDVNSKIQEVLASTLEEILTVKKYDLFKNIREVNQNGKVFTIIFFGINGSGKTTTIAKLAKLLKSLGLTVVLAAADTFRAAAIDQLENHATKLGVKIIKHDYGSDSAAVAYDAKKYAQKNKIDVVLIDTAGRLHSNINLMAELEKIVRVTKPDCKIFIGESVTGNDCIEQAVKYENSLGIDGVILTKADVDEMGGAPLSICYVTKKPILYLGVGQEYADLQYFSAELILDKLGLNPN